MIKANKLKIGVTGSIGSGKSLFCSLLVKNGFPVISADEESKKILAENPEAKKKIIKAFGEESFLEGTINKPYLAQTVFSDPEKVIQINSILHPVVIRKIEALIKEQHKKHALVFVEAALIYEADMEDLFDYVVLVSADEAIRKQRKVELDKFAEEDFISRNNNQIPDEEKKKRADFVFINNGTEQDLENKAGFLIVMLKGLAGSAST